MPRAIRNWSQATETARQVRRFLVVGSLCVVVDLAVYTTLATTLGVGTNLSKGTSYLVGVIVGFILNKWWTFQSSRRSWTEPASYLLLYGTTLFVNVACNHIALASLGEEHRLVAYLFATGVTTVLNFLGMRLVTFRTALSNRHDDDAQAAESRSALHRIG